MFFRFNQQQGLMETLVNRMPSRTKGDNIDRCVSSAWRPW
jgi:hypothetical protein